MSTSRAPLSPRPAARHRRRPHATRPALVSIVAVFALVLASGVALTLTGAPSGERSGEAPALDDTAPGGSTGPSSGASSEHEGAGALAGPTAPAGTTGATPDRHTGPGRSTGGPPARGADAPAVSIPPTPSGDADAGAGTPGDAGGQQAGAPDDERTQWEDEVTRLTNQERAAAGCDPVTTDERLRAAARGHSADMAAHDYFDHTGRDGRSPGERMADAGYPRPGGENIAMGYPDPESVTAGWMGSEGHRRNMLTCDYETTGVGLSRDDRGRPYWTQVFGY